MKVDNNIMLVCKEFEYSSRKLYELEEIKPYLIKIITKKIESIMDVYLAKYDKELIFLKMSGTDYYISMYCPTMIYFTDT